MPADKRSVEITLKLDAIGDESDTSNQTNTNTNAKNNDKDKSAKAIAWAFAAREASVIANEVVAWAEYEWNKELTLADDYISQREKRIAMTQINRSISVSTSILSSAATGAAMAGPFAAVGAVVGAAIGTVNQAVSIVRSNYQSRDQQDIAMRQLDAQLGFTRSRVGWSLQAASIGENL